MTRSDRGRALVAELPMDRLLTETDGPFTQVDGRPTEPSDAAEAINAIARVRNLATDAIDKAIRTNLQTLLR
jgi:TatD DNase family protein